MAKKKKKKVKRKRGFQWTPKRRAFCREYPKDLNGTKAAIRAKYAKHSARQMAAHLLSKVNIQQEIAKHAEKQAEIAEIEGVEVLRELKKIGFSNIKNYLSFGPAGVVLKNIEDLTDEQLAAIESISETTTQHGGTIRFKLHGKVHSLELLGKHLKLFTEMIEGNLTLAQAVHKAMTDDKK